MARTITQLTAAGTIVGADLLWLEQSGLPRKVTMTEIAAFTGGGDVSKVGTPVNNQVGVWTGDGTIEGDAGLTWDGTALRLGTGVDFLFIDGKEAIDGNDAFLRINQNADFTSGTYTPGNFRADGHIQVGSGPLARMSSAGAITAVSYGGITEVNLVDRSATEDISGKWRFTATGTSGDRNGSLNIYSIQPAITWQETDAPADEKVWFDFISAGVRYGRAYNDAFSAFNDYETRTRAGTAVSMFWGYTSLSAATTDVDFDAITATSYGGITEANLLDKTAVETITANWIIDVETGGPHLHVKGGNGGATLAIFQRDVGTDALIAINATNGEPQIVFDASLGARQWYIGADAADQFVIGDGASVNSNDRLTVTASGDVSATSFGGITEANLVDKTAAESITADWNWNDNVIERAEFDDYAILHQNVTGVASTTFNYSSGQSINLQLGAANVTTLTISNWPASGSFGCLEVLVTQGATPRTVAWPAAVNWPDGTAPDLATANGRFLVYLRTVDAGTNIEGTFTPAMS